MRGPQSQISQGNPLGMSSFGTMSVPFSIRAGVPSVPSYTAQQHLPANQRPRQPNILGNEHRSHMQGTGYSSPQQQAYAKDIAKERLLQQRMRPHSQQSHSPPNSMSTVQNNSQIQQQSQPSSCASLTSLHPQYNKQQMPHNPQSSSGMPNQVIKQRPQQQAQQQQPKHRQQQKQLVQKQAKVVNGLSKGAALIDQNPTIPSPASSTPPATSKQISDKDLLQKGQGFFHGKSSFDPMLPRSSNHQNLPSHPFSRSSNQIPQLASYPDTCSQGPAPVSSNQTLSSFQPSRHPLATPSLQQQQLNQNIERMPLQRKKQLAADDRIQSPGDQVQNVTQMIQASLPRCVDLTTSAPSGSSAMQLKPEPSYDSRITAPTTQSIGPLHENFVGTETSLPSSSESIEQRRLFRSTSLDGHGVRGQWHPTPPQPLPQLQEQQQQPQPPHRVGAQCIRPSSSGPS